MRVDLWAELPSPVKTAFRDAFLRYARELYAEKRVALSSYIPAGMGAQMPEEDYLLSMPEEQLPDCYLTMAFGECSMPAFAQRFLETGIYAQPEVFAFFPELMVIDRRRLGERPMPESYEALADPVYRGEICLIGNRGEADPLLPLYIYEKMGVEGLRQLRENMATPAAPSVTIRHLGRKDNRFGSIFLMPAVFARVCEEKKDTTVFCPSEGALAEPILLFRRLGADERRQDPVRSFCQSSSAAEPLRAMLFPVAGQPSAEDLPIEPFCRKKLLYPERFERKFRDAFSFSAVSAV